MIPLPTMNRICKYWNLPSEFQEACDYYFLRNYSDQDFVSLLSVLEDGNPIIREYGINFQVIFQGEAEKVYVSNGEKALRKEPNNTFYWCSFRSLTFEFGNRKETKSFVLVQVDKKAGLGEKQDDLEELKGKASGAAGAIKFQIEELPQKFQNPRLFNSPQLEIYKGREEVFQDLEFKRNNKVLLHGMNYGMGANLLRKAFSSSDAFSEYERLQELKEDERTERGEKE